jgi:hypothetical protein
MHHIWGGRLHTFRDFINLFSDSAFARDCRRRRMPWYCFAFTYTGSSSIISDGNGMRACCTPSICGWICRPFHCQSHTYMLSLAQSHMVQKHSDTHSSFLTKGHISENKLPGSLGHKHHLILPNSMLHLLYLFLWQEFESCTSEM